MEPDVRPEDHLKGQVISSICLSLLILTGGHKNSDLGAGRQLPYAHKTKPRPRGSGLGLECGHLSAGVRTCECNGTRNQSLHPLVLSTTQEELSANF